MDARLRLVLALTGALWLPIDLAQARGGAPPTEYLDEHTGATVTIANKPLVFARERSERAANMRDYVNLSAASVNRGGKVEYVLIAYLWSTLDPRFADVLNADSMLLVADDRRIVLNANGKQPSDLGIAETVQAPPGQNLKPMVFATDLATLRFIAAARKVALQVVAGEDAYGYDLWEDQRAALGRFVEFLNGQR
jgi:hypothetical protein